VKQVLPWILSANTILLMWLIGNKKWWAWLFGLAGQGLWILFAIIYQAWGLLPLATFLIIVYARNLMKWHRETKIAFISG
jgi:hypothetical protein